MKKFVFFLSFLLLTLALFLNVSAQQLYYNDAYHNYEAGVIGLKVNGKAITDLPMNPVIIDDYTMVPVREVFEAMGCEVIWHDDTCQAEVKDEGVSVIVKIGDRVASANGQSVMIEEPQPLPMLIGKDPSLLKTMVPVRFIAERLGFSVEWDNSTRTVLITDNVSELIGGTEQPENVVTEIVMPQEAGSFGTVIAETDAKYDYVYVSTLYGISPVVTRFDNPERVVFDFPGAAFAVNGNILSLNGNCVKNVRYSNYNGQARVVLDLSDNAQTVIKSSERGILIRAERSENEQIIYDAFAQRVYFDKNYAGSGIAIDNGYKVTFTDLKLKNQKIEIHDNVIYEIIITEQSNGCSVTVDGSNKLSYTAEKGIYKTETVNTPAPPQTSENSTTAPIPEKAEGTIRILLDAGHGGADPGAIGYDANENPVAYESHINLKIALLLEQKLEANGIEVIQTRSDDSEVNLKPRVEMEKSSECDYFVSIHCNSIARPEVNGTQVYYHPASEYGTLLAKNVYAKMVEVTGLKPMNLQNGSHLYVIRNTDSPAILVETAFISNESDRNYLLSKEGQEAIANAICQGILNTVK